MNYLLYLIVSTACCLPLCLVWGGQEAVSTSVWLPSSTTPAVCQVTYISWRILLGAQHVPFVPWQAPCLRWSRRMEWYDDVTSDVTCQVSKSPRQGRASSQDCRPCVGWQRSTCRPPRWSPARLWGCDSGTEISLSPLRAVWGDSSSKTTSRSPSPRRGRSSPSARASPTSCPVWGVREPVTGWRPRVSPWPPACWPSVKEGFKKISFPHWDYSALFYFFLASKTCK